MAMQVRRRSGHSPANSGNARGADLWFVDLATVLAVPFASVTEKEMNKTNLGNVGKACFPSL